MEDPMYAEAVLAENGVIRAVGSLDALKAAAGDCEMVDLQGAVMLPGFIDAHSHFFQVAASFLQVSVDGCDTSEKICSRIQAFIAEKNIAPGQWVNVRDYDNNIMPGLKNPTLEQLDAFAPNNPLVIHHKSGHMGLMNTMALNTMGITAETPSPEGGRIETVDGKLTGYLEENAFIETIKRMPMPSFQELLSSFTDAQKKYASYGITTVQDGMVAKPMLPMFELLLNQEKLFLDVKLYAGLDTFQDVKAMLKKYPKNRHMQCGGLKIFLDGSPQGRTAWMRTPYEGTPDYCGYGTMTDEAVEAAFRMAGEENTQIIAHCNGDGASEQFIRCMEHVQKEYPQLKKLRPVIIHGQLLGLDQLPRVKALDAMVSFFVAHVYHWGDVHIRNFGMERAKQLSPTRSALNAGIPFTFHQDSPVIEPNMLETIWCAVNRQTKSGVTLGEQEKIGVLDALKAITINGAYQYFEEHKKGSIAAGKVADFVVLDRDPLAVQPEELRDLKVLATYKGGTCIYRR